MWVHNLNRGAQKEMDEACHAALRAFAGGAGRAVLVEGLGERAFCSGSFPAACGAAYLAFWTAVLAIRGRRAAQSLGELRICSTHLPLTSRRVVWETDLLLRSLASCLCSPELCCKFWHANRVLEAKRPAVLP